MKKKKKRPHLPKVRLLEEKKSFPIPAGLDMNRKCDLLLINSPIKQPSKESTHYIHNPPLGEAYILSEAEKEKFNCGLIDAEGLGISIHRLKSVARDIDPKWIGINTFSPIFEYTMEIIDLLETNSQIMVGGPHATIEPETTLKRQPKIDVVIRGEGEKVVKKILEGQALSRISGISYCNNGRIVHNPPSSLEEKLDQLSLNRDFLEIDPYKRGDYIVSAISTSRGCCFDCSFCAGPSISGKKVRTRSMEDVADEISELVNGKYGINYIRFLDDFFLFNNERANEFLRIFKKKGLLGKFRWDAQTRVDNLLRFGGNLMKRISNSGVEFLSLGIETGNSERLREIHKRITLEEIEQVIKRCFYFGIPTKGYFLIGFPRETEKEMLKTIDFAKDLKNKGLSEATFNELRPYPGTEIYQGLLEEGWEVQELMDYQTVDLTSSSTERYSEERVTCPTGLRQSISDVDSDRIRQILRRGVLAFQEYSGIDFYGGVA